MRWHSFFYSLFLSIASSLHRLTKRMKKCKQRENKKDSHLKEKKN